jgi:hypothetical protein
MKSFSREGQFKDRDAFIAALRVKLEKLRDGILRGATLEWADDRASIEGFGARVIFNVGPAAWTCEATLPSFLPVSQKTVEAKFDEEFGELKGL